MEKIILPKKKKIILQKYVSWNKSRGTKCLLLNSVTNRKKAAAISYSSLK